MPLTRGRTIGYNVSRMTFEFTMMDDKAKIVTCEISSVAIDHLAGTRGILPAEREAQFLRGTGSSELHLNFLTEWPDIQAGRSASSTMMFGNASCAVGAHVQTLLANAGGTNVTLLKQRA